MYQYAMTVIFHEMPHDYLEDYIDDIVLKFKEKSVTMSMIWGKNLLDVGLQLENERFEECFLVYSRKI